MPSPNPERLEWWTKDQSEYVGALALSEIVAPALEGLERDPDPNALISLEVRVEKPVAPSPLPREPNDIFLLAKGWCTDRLRPSFRTGMRRAP